MKRYFIILCSLMIFSICLSAQRPYEYEGLNIKSKNLKKNIDYSVILPSDYYNGNKSYPVVYFLHGIGGDCSTWLEYGHLASLMNEMVNNSEIEPFIMVMPSGYLSYYCNSYDGKYAYESFLIDELYKHIEKKYRVNKGADQHAVVGFSMGGFGSLTLGLRYPHLFGSIVALSPSIRTDGQYISEGPQEGWDDQWGKTFGGVGTNGHDRLTAYYKSHSPYHIIDKCADASSLDYRIFIDVGDKENSLCRSNEELHRLLLNKNVKHYWTVRGGYHDFDVWNAAMPSALRYLNARFHAQIYSAQKSPIAVNDNVHLELKKSFFSDDYYPIGALDSKRKFPVIYITGANSANRYQALRTATMMMEKGQMPPLILSFVNSDCFTLNQLHSHEKDNSMIRDNQRMRGIISMQNSVATTLPFLKTENCFTAYVLAYPIDNTQDMADVCKWICSYKRYPRFWIEMNSQSKEYGRYSDLHIMLRENDKEHEFRSEMEPTGNKWQNWFQFLIKRIYV